MKAELLATLNRARTEKRRVCLLRYLGDGSMALVVDGAGVGKERRPNGRMYRDDPASTGGLEAAVSGRT